jgi:hypothetical protein
MDAIDLKKAVLKRMDGLPMPKRLNGFQIFFFEPSRGIRQYSTGLPNCKFRDNLKLLIDEVIQQCDRSEPKLREKDIDKKLKETLGTPVTRLPQAEFVITILKRPHVEVTERWWSTPRVVEVEDELNFGSRVPSTIDFPG